MFCIGFLMPCVHLLHICRICFLDRPQGTVERGLESSFFVADRANYRISTNLPRDFYSHRKAREGKRQLVQWTIWRGRTSPSRANSHCIAAHISDSGRPEEEVNAKSYFYGSCIFRSCVVQQRNSKLFYNMFYP